LRHIGLEADENSRTVTAYASDEHGVACDEYHRTVVEKRHGITAKQRVRGIPRSILQSHPGERIGEQASPPISLMFMPLNDVRLYGPTVSDWRN